MDAEKIILGVIGGVSTFGVAIVTTYIKNNFVNLKNEIKNEFSLGFHTLNSNVDEIKKEHGLIKEIVLGLEKRLDIYENNNVLKMTRKNQLLNTYDQVFRDIDYPKLKKFAKIYVNRFTDTMIKTYDIVDAKNFDELMFNNVAQSNINELASLKPFCIEYLGSDFANFFYSQIHPAGMEFLEKTKSITLRKRNNKVNELHLYCCNYLYMNLGDMITLYEQFNSGSN